MSRFEAIGCDMQYSSRSPREAERKFERSCQACTLRGFRRDCSSCAIRDTHENIMLGFSCASCASA